MLTMGWDDGLRCPPRSLVSTPATELPLDTSFVSDQILRTNNEPHEQEAIELYLAAAVDFWEHYTGKAAMSQTRQLILSGFPRGERIVLPAPPLISVPSIQYYDENGDSQTLAGSPETFKVLVSGRYKKAEVRPLQDETWPSTQVRPDAVTVTFQCGHANANDFPASDKVGILMLTGELYKQRTLSVHAVHNTASVLQLERIWRKVW